MEQEQRLIDAKEIREAVFRMDLTGIHEWTSTDVLLLIDRQREVDAIPVVRCRDCKSANVRDDMGEDFYECSQNGVTVFCNGGHFCSYGEPRTPPAE